MRNPDGHVWVTYPDDHKLDKEVDTVFCAHCGRHTHLKPNETPEFTCKLCMGFICGVCENRLRTEGCKPHEEMLLEMEGKIRRKLAKERYFHAALK